MENILTKVAAKEVDTYCIRQTKIPSMVLMERAAYSVACEADRLMQEQWGEQRFFVPVIAVCGTGNNGADGIAAIRILREKGYTCRLCLLSDGSRATEEFRLQHEIAKKLQFAISVCDSEEKVEAYTFDQNMFVIDAMFGIGLSREVTGHYAAMIEKINQLPRMLAMRKILTVLSVDIASGLDASTGKVMGAAVVADCTVTFGKYKAGLVLCEGRDYSGRIVVGDAGFVKEAYSYVEDHYPQEVFACLQKADLSRFPARKKTFHKGSTLCVRVIGGGEKLSGAAILAGSAAYACGTGLVKIYAGRDSEQVIRTCLKEAVVKEFSEFFSEKIQPEKEVLVIGPGLGTHQEALKALETALSQKCKIVLDADALNLLGENRMLLEKLHEECILTPHIGEMSRLTGRKKSEIRENIVACARAFSSAYGCITVLKDATTVICAPSGWVTVNLSGNSGMAKGGSGDVLSGIIGSLLSQHMTPYEAAALGVYLHGLAGDRAAEKKGTYSMLAGDIVEGIAEVLRKQGVCECDRKQQQPGGLARK